MKKTIFLVALICCAMTTAFTSCDKDQNKPENEDTTPVAAVMNFSFNVGDDILGSFDVTVEYYNTEGKLQTEQMTQNEWEKIVKANLPVKLGARLRIQPKEGVNFENLERFTAAYGYSYSGHSVSANGKTVGNQVMGGTESSMAMKGDKVLTWHERHADGIVKFLYSFAADGQATSTSWE